jgi:transcriptional regulator GlxA family with amidase domain
MGPREPAVVVVLVYDGVRHLSRLFQTEIGATPASYVASVRLEAATALLRSGETLGTAARRSGIGSEETLRRAMRRGAVTGRR